MLKMRILHQPEISTLDMLNNRCPGHAKIHILYQLEASCLHMPTKPKSVLLLNFNFFSGFVFWIWGLLGGEVKVINARLKRTW